MVMSYLLSYRAVLVKLSLFDSGCIYSSLVWGELPELLNSGLQISVPKTRNVTIVWYIIYFDALVRAWCHALVSTSMLISSLT